MRERNDQFYVLITLKFVFVKVDELLLFIIFPLYLLTDVEWRSSVDMLVDVEPGVLGRSPIARMPRINNERDFIYIVIVSLRLQINWVLGKINLRK